VVVHLVNTLQIFHRICR